MALTEKEEIKVSFTGSNHVDGSRNGEAKVDIEQMQTPYAGMTKEELMKFANDPFWVRLRWICFMMFWLVWLMMLVGAIIIIVMAERCAPEPTADWWQKSAVYSIYPRSFKDSDGDGIGDLKGIQSELDYIDDLKVKTLLLDAIYESPMTDLGNDVTDHTQIASIFGTMDDFNNLVADMKTRDMKLILTFIATHTSNKHRWFELSRDRAAGYEDFYIWRDGKGVGKTEYPTNWLSVYGGPAWTYDETRGQFYQHDFFPGEPSLNLSNPRVLEELEGVLKFWLDAGVAGFRVDSASRLIKDKQFRNEPRSPDLNIEPDEGNYAMLDHQFTTNRPEVFGILAQWKHFINNYTGGDYHRVLMTDVEDSMFNVLKYYGSDNVEGADLPLNYQLVNVSANTSGADLQGMAEDWRDELATVRPGGWSTWMLGTSNKQRVGSRVGTGLVDGMNMLVMLLGGTPVTYYGEEIGMTDTQVSFQQTQDPVARAFGQDNYMMHSRDPQRTPMQWRNETNGGFSDGGSTWLPVNTDYLYINVEAQKDNRRSHLSLYKQLVTLRAQPTILFGRLDFARGLNKDIVGIARAKKGTPGYVVLVNLGPTAQTINALAAFENDEFTISSDGTLEMCSGNIPHTSPIKCDVARFRLPLENVELGPYQAVVVKFVPTYK